MTVDSEFTRAKCFLCSLYCHLQFPYFGLKQTLRRCAKYRPGCWAMLGRRYADGSQIILSSTDLSPSCCRVGIPQSPHTPNGQVEFLICRKTTPALFHLWYHHHPPGHPSQKPRSPPQFWPMLDSAYSGPNIQISLKAVCSSPSAPPSLSSGLCCLSPPCV